MLVSDMKVIAKDRGGNGQYVLEKYFQTDTQEKIHKAVDPKGQIISECPYEKIVYPKIATKKFPRFLSWPLRRGQIKNFIKPIMLNNP